MNGEVHLVEMSPAKALALAAWEAALVEMKHAKAAYDAAVLKVRDTTQAYAEIAGEAKP